MCTCSYDERVRVRTYTYVRVCVPMMSVCVRTLQCVCVPMMSMCVRAYVRMYIDVHACGACECVR